MEDPVEYLLAGINQVQVNETVGLTFAMALRSMLRQAPNVIMLGEIRDMETATIAINASLTGHLVFSTLHTNDAPERRHPFDRHRGQAVPGRLFRRGRLMAQRLVRKVCKRCAAPYQPTDSELAGFEPGPRQSFRRNFHAAAKAATTATKRAIAGVLEFLRYL